MFQYKRRTAYSDCSFVFLLSGGHDNLKTRGKHRIIQKNFRKRKMYSIIGKNIGIFFLGYLNRVVMLRGVISR